MQKLIGLILNLVSHFIVWMFLAKYLIWWFFYLIFKQTGFNKLNSENWIIMKKQFIHLKKIKMMFFKLKYLFIMQIYKL